MTLRAFLAVLFLAPALASAQDPAAFFPYEVGDRWIYAVEGTTGGDTVQAVVEWTIDEIGAHPETDTLTVQVVRRDPDATEVSSTCLIQIFKPQEGRWQAWMFRAQEGDLALCRASGGLPFGQGQTTSYPFLYWPHPSEESEVAIGSEVYEVETVEAQFSNDYSAGPRPPYVSYSTQAQALMADGIGIVSATVIETATDVGTTPPDRLRRDTVRTQLLGAVVGGQEYGDLQVVSAEPGPMPPQLAIQWSPNPVRGAATVHFLNSRPGAQARLQVFDTAGRLVLERTVATGSPVRLRVDALPAGVYVARAVIGEEVTYTRFVVLR